MPPQTSSILIPTKFCHVHKIYTCQQNFPHASWIYSTKPTQKKFHNFNAPKIQAKIHSITSHIANITKIPWATNIVQDCTMSIQNVPRAKIITWSIIQCPKFQKEHTTTKWQCLNIKLSMKHEQKKISQKKNSPWSPCGNVEHGFRGLEGGPLHHSFQVMDGIFFSPWKVRKEGPLEDDAIVVQREGKFGNGFHKMGMKQKWPRTERSKKILRMSEGKWRSLGKCFFREEMVSWRRKFKWKKEVNSDNGGRKLKEERKVKKNKKEKTKKDVPNSPHPCFKKKFLFSFLSFF